MPKKLFTIAASLMVLGSLAVAQTSFSFTKAARATIPFSFTVGDQVFPAGVYVAQLDRQNHIVLLRDQDKKARLFLANNDDAKQISRNSQLIFRHLGDRFFLTAVFVGGSSEGERLLPGKVENELARHESGPAKILAVQAQASANSAF
jgi:hypothetical protein